MDEKPSTGSARLVLVEGVRHLHPDDAVFEAMLTGWRRQQLSRHLALSTIERRDTLVRRFQESCGEYPWRWTAAHLEEWVVDLRIGGARARTTIRSYQLDVRTFLAYVTNPVYGWAEVCLERFGTHPVQICHDRNIAAHVADLEARPTRRALTRGELQDLFDLADSDVAVARRLGRKGWLAAFRDATVFKVAYAWGLRRSEVRLLDVEDFGRNPKAPEFAERGVCYVRHGKGARGSGPRRRSVLTVFPWSTDVVAEWVDDIRPRYWPGVGRALWPSERTGPVTEHQLNARFAALRDRLGLARGVGMHSLRHSYVTHLIEDGWDPLFVQQQVGHEYASSTAIYTSVSSDYRTRTVRAALDRLADQARARSHDPTNLVSVAAA